MATVLEPTLMPHLPDKLTVRTERLRNELRERAITNRTNDWLSPDRLPDLALKQPGATVLEPVIVRRARGIDAMLKAMSDPEQSKPTPSYTIFADELLVGVPTMGSNGLGKVFPNYLDEDERRMASIANRSELSVFGHNAADYPRLLKHGIRGILDFCAKQIAGIDQLDFVSPSDADRRDFYQAVTISCRAVVDYAHRFADLAGNQAKTEPDLQRKHELLRIEQICRKVPMEPAETLYEALQSILFVHIALRAGMDLTSFGRLDQTLQPYLKSTVEPGVQDLHTAVELVECFVIKTAWPLNLTTQYLVEQDHIDYGIMLGTRAYYADQRGNTNNFLQNVVVGGKQPDGRDATVDCTHVVLQAFANVNLPTPGLYVRLHSKSPTELRQRVARALSQTKNIPAILNDDVIIPAVHQALVEKQPEMTATYAPLAHDYCVDGCWEPILNGQSDWTMNMINGMTILECALNEGATLDSNPMTLRGSKRTYRTRPVVDRISLEHALGETMDFLVTQSAVAMYNYYLLDEYITPTPLLSAFLGTCLERGRDKSWGGTKYCLGGTILEGLPNMVNSVCAIDKWVFDAQKYRMQDVLGAFRYDFTAPDTNPAQQALYDELHADFFSNSPKFGSNDPKSNAVARMILGKFVKAVEDAKTLADSVYLRTPDDPAEEKRVRRLRQAAGYYGPALTERLKDDFIIRFTAGLGTFEIYALLGQGVAASADRHANDPLAMNITPPPGTVDGGYGHILASLRSLELDRFAAGAVTDLCLEVQEGTDNVALVDAVIGKFLKSHGHTLSLTLGDTTEFQKIYELSSAASKMTDRAAASALLKPWGHVNVRAGGWQTAFISLSLTQQKHYAQSPITSQQA